MEDSNEMHSEENKATVEKHPKRILKTPAQIQALEKFYSEHNYPTEEMKAEVAEEIGLTEKQISSWFCHRRLKDKKVSKDETNVNGRQGRSSTVQDRGSGLRQDSCGSTKQGDYRKVDPKEVESQRLYGHNYPSADINYDGTSRYMENLDVMDDTSSESSSSLHEKFLSQSDDYYDMKSPGYVTQNGTGRPSIPKGANNMGYKPSGYLKVKGEIENAAITAVKRQLGKHYRQDGPPLGVEFEPLPPGAFSPLNRDLVNGGFYVGDLTRNQSTTVSGVRKPSSMSNRYEAYSSKMSSHDLYMDGTNCNLKNTSDSHDRNSDRELKQKAIYSRSNSSPGGKSAADKYDDFATETSIHSSKRNYKLSSKHTVEGLRRDAVSSHHHDGGYFTREPTGTWLDDYNNANTKILQRNDYIPKPNLILGSSRSHDAEEQVLSTRTKKEKLFREMNRMEEYRDAVRARNHPTNETKVPKHFGSEYPLREYRSKASFPDMPQRTNSNKGSTMERHSFSEDEADETSSSG